MGHLVSTTDQLNHSVSYGFDAANRQTLVSNALSQATTTRYDPASLVTTVIDPSSNQVNYAYDKDNLRTKVTDAMGKVTSTQYDLAGRATLVTDPNTHSTTTGYDDANRVVSVTNGAQEDDHHDLRHCGPGDAGAGSADPSDDHGI